MITAEAARSKSEFHRQRKIDAQYGRFKAEMQNAITAAMETGQFRASIQMKEPENAAVLALTRDLEAAGYCVHSGQSLWSNNLDERLTLLTASWS